eukprot:c23961_g1_i2 orf=179-685(-)
MGSRKAMEDLRATASSDVYRPPTLQPGLGPPRCPRCSAPLSKDLEASGWTIAPFVKDSFAMIGTAVGGTVSAFYGFNHAMPPIRRWITGPVWLQFAVGLPPLIIFSISCAGLAENIVVLEVGSMTLQLGSLKEYQVNAQGGKYLLWSYSKRRLQKNCIYIIDEALSTL